MFTPYICWLFWLNQMRIEILWISNDVKDSKSERSVNICGMTSQPQRVAYWWVHFKTICNIFLSRSDLKLMFSWIITRFVAVAHSHRSGPLGSPGGHRCCVHHLLHSGWFLWRRKVSLFIYYFIIVNPIKEVPIYWFMKLFLNICFRSFLFSFCDLKI